MSGYAPCAHLLTRAVFRGDHNYAGLIRGEGNVSPKYLRLTVLTISRRKKGTCIMYMFTFTYTGFQWGGVPLVAM